MALLCLANKYSPIFCINRDKNGIEYQKHFLCTMDAPVSLYSALVIHMFWNEDRELKMDPPIQTRNFLSCGAKIFTFMAGGLRLVISLLSLSEMPGNIVEPPLSTMLENKSFLISTSDFMMDWWIISCNPGIYLPTNMGSNRDYGHLNNWLPIVIFWPSGSS